MAVLGTLLGSVVTHAFQRRDARRAEEFARSEALRQERIATYSTFAAAVEDYRHGQSDRWYRSVGDPGGAAFIAARDEAHRLRTVARQALYRVKLLTDDAQVTAAAERAYRCTWAVSTAREQEEHDALDTESRRAIEGFVSVAAPLVR